ncbi:MAG: hypothetical protein PVH40_02615 [Gemmatimonadales bacterium]
MPVMQCLECGMEARPKSYHPSNLRVEASLWAIAVCVGMIVGVSSTIEGPASPAGAGVTALTAVTSLEAAPQPPGMALDRGARQSVTLRISNWIRGKLGLFLRSAWWVLPIPILFSVWRQASKRAGCPKCGSRKLIPAPEEAWP